MTDTTLPAPSQDRAFFVFTGVISVLALGFLAYLLLVRKGGDGGWDLRFMPAVNASLNATSAVLITTGLVFIKRGNPQVHRVMMVGAVTASALFLVGYILYHAAHGDTKYAGEGVMRTVYLTVLASHVVLSIPIVPMVLTTIYFAIKKRHASHKKIAKWTYPIWLYVSVTGVVVYFMLRGSAPAV